MIIIIGMLLLLTMPFFIYWGSGGVIVRKRAFIAYEALAIAALVFFSILVVLDVPYIIEGGQLYEERPIYIEPAKGVTSVGNDEETFLMDDDVYIDNINAAAVYVLPHTHLVYKIETNDFFDPVPYHIKEMGAFSFVLLVFEIVFLGVIIKAWYKTI